jgi:hypothetical protein
MALRDCLFKLCYVSLIGCWCRPATTSNRYVVYSVLLVRLFRLLIRKRLISLLRYRPGRSQSEMLFGLLISVLVLQLGEYSQILFRSDAAFIKVKAANRVGWLRWCNWIWLLHTTTFKRLNSFRLGYVDDFLVTPVREFIFRLAQRRLRLFSFTLVHSKAWSRGIGAFVPCLMLRRNPHFYLSLI